jgi:seryl-tRNA(Sec) selenium transferase
MRAITRREVFRRGGLLGGLLALPAWLRGAPDAADRVSAVAGSGATTDVYSSIGVRPLINGRGTYTVLSGSLMLPEVRAAMDEAARRYVQLDELTDAIGARLAALTGAEWGLVTAGCAAALVHASAACVAGGNPDRHIRIPHLAGLPRDEAIIPKHSRNVYDAAVRAVGLRVIEVETAADLDAALGPRTALVYVLAGPNADEGPLTTRSICAAARARGVPVLVDAAAEIMTVPNVHLEAGASLVAYSGGKCLRGPQTAGLLLGRKDLVRAAWVSSAPHHGPGRSMKVGKEEAIGMLTAVEMWTRRDHAGEWRQWTAWLDVIARRVSSIPGVTTSVVQPVGLSNRTPSLDVRWDAKRLGIDGEAVSRHLFETDPRVALSPADEKAGEGTGVSITPYMLSAGDERVIADRLTAVLSSPPPQATAGDAAPAADLTGQWDVRIEYAASSSSHAFHLRQRDGVLDGAHQGDFITRDLTGFIRGDRVSIRSSYTEEHGDALGYSFSGRVTGDEMGGALDMGEYLGARWTAKRRAYGRA